jgi:hypothetical protein
MRVLVVGANNEQVASAIHIAIRQGATLRHVATPEAAIQELCAGRGASRPGTSPVWSAQSASTPAGGSACPSRPAQAGPGGGITV